MYVNKSFWSFFDLRAIAKIFHKMLDRYHEHLLEVAAKNAQSWEEESEPFLHSNLKKKHTISKLNYKNIVRLLHIKKPHNQDIKKADLA